MSVERDGSTFSVLTGLPRASRWAEIAPHKATAVLDLLITMFDVVIVDTGFGVEENEWIDDAPQRDGTTRTLLRNADSVVAVGSSDAVSMARIIRGLDEIRDFCPSPVLILNRVNKGDAGEARDVIHRFTDHRVRLLIHADNRGGVEDALGRARSQSAVWRELAEYVGLTLQTSRKVWWRR
jgi:Flp pilus assembly CpaE family ATPase